VSFVSPPRILFLHVLLLLLLLLPPPPLLPGFRSLSRQAIASIPVFSCIC
jgi:hypothetical protein